MLKYDKTVDGALIKDIGHGSEKKVVAVCDSCGKERDIIYHNYTMSQKKRGWDGKTFCRSCSASLNAKKHFTGAEPWNKGSCKDIGDRQLCSYISSDGYKMIPNGKFDNNVKWNMWSKEHTVKIEKQIGRMLKKNECIHHINGDKLDNRMNNLELMTRKEHKEAHFSLQEIGYDLVKKGLVKFDSKNKRYIKTQMLKDLI